MCICIPNSNESHPKESLWQRALRQSPRMLFLSIALLQFPLLLAFGHHDWGSLLWLMATLLPSALSAWLSQHGEERNGYQPPSLIRLNLTWWLTLIGCVMTQLGASTPPLRLLGITVALGGSWLLWSDWRRRRFWLR